MLIPIGSQGSFGLLGAVGTKGVFGLSIPVISSQSVSPSPSLSTSELVEIGSHGSFGLLVGPSSSFGGDNGVFGLSIPVVSSQSVSPSPSLSTSELVEIGSHGSFGLLVGPSSSFGGDNGVPGSSIPVVSSQSVSPSPSLSTNEGQSATSLSVMVTVPLGSVLLVFPLVTVPLTVKSSSNSSIKSSRIGIDTLTLVCPAGIVAVTVVLV